MKLYVMNLPFDAKSEDVEKLFQEFGIVESAAVMYDRETHASKGFAIVRMASELGGRDAIDGLNGQKYGGMVLDVVESRPPVKHLRSNWGIQFVSPSTHDHNRSRF